MKRIRITFSKTDLLRFIGHLDLHHLWVRTFRRAGLQLVYSQGFHPQPKLHLASALSLGYTGSNEIMECWFEEDLPLEEIQARLTERSHPGIVIRELEVIDASALPLQIRLNGARYQINIPARAAVGLDQKLKELFARDEIIIDRKNKPVNIRPFLLDFALNESDETEPRLLDLHLAAGENHNGRVDEVLDLLQIDPLDCLVERTSLEIA